MGESLLASGIMSSISGAGNASVEVFGLAPFDGPYNKIWQNLYTCRDTPVSVLIIVSCVYMNGTAYYPHAAASSDPDWIPDVLLTLSDTTPIQIYGLQTSFYSILYKLQSNVIQGCYSYTYSNEGAYTNGITGISGIGFAFY